MIANQDNPYSVLEFQFKDGKGMFKIVIERYKILYVNLDIPLLIKIKMKELPVDKEILGEAEIYKTSNTFQFHDEVNVHFKYRQLPKSETLEKLESERINHFVNNIQLIQQ